MPGYIEFVKVTKRYSKDAACAIALNDASFTVEQGEFCVIVGPSGAGKTTALNILGGIDRCSSGSVMVDGEDIATYNEKRLTLYRRGRVGFVFQFYNLMPGLNALENVQLAAELCKNPVDPQSLLDIVNLSDKTTSFPSQLSGGEQQRVAIARALAKRPKLLLCDEPTGALDETSGLQILQLLQNLSVGAAMTVVLITHNLAIAQIANKVISMRNGAVEGIAMNAQPKKAGELVL
jgi:putative ABC transport system ATP-binding protein